MPEGAASGMTVWPLIRMKTILSCCSPTTTGWTSTSAYSDLSIALDGVTFPDEAQEPIIMELSLNAMPTIEVSIEAPNAENLLSYVEDNIVPDIEALNEVAKVDLYGGEENYVRVMLNEELMSQYGLSISSVAGFITAADITSAALRPARRYRRLRRVASSEITP
jgi:HAE1 family hydrophobic/amphiphilic exporter-1